MIPISVDIFVMHIFVNIVIFQFILKSDDICVKKDY